MPRACKPAVTHKSNGTYRPSVHGNAVLPVEIPPAPADLSATSQAFWNVTTEELRRAGLISFCDGRMLRLAAESWDIYLQSMDDIAANGIVHRTEKKTMLNPAIRARDAAWKQLFDVLKQFGMSPSARTGLRVGEVAGDLSEEQRVASILQLRKA